MSIFRITALGGIVLLSVACSQQPEAAVDEWSSTELRLEASLRGDLATWAIPVQGLFCEIHSNPESGFTVQVGANEGQYQFEGPGFGLATVTITDGVNTRSTSLLDGGIDSADGSITRIPVASGTGTRGWFYLSMMESSEIFAVEGQPVGCSIEFATSDTDEPIPWVEPDA